MKTIVKTKKIKFAPGETDGNMSELFNNMLGATNLHFAYPRYIRLREMCEKIIKSFELFSRSPTAQVFKDFTQQFAEMRGYCTRARESIATLWDVNLGDFSFNLDLVDESLKEKFVDSYQNVRKCDLVNTFVVMCDRLVPYKAHLTDDALSADFILRMSGVEYLPFPFCKLNVKQLVSTIVSSCDGTDRSKNATDGHLQLVMTYIANAYKFSRAIWDDLQEPDADVDKFIDVLLAGLERIKKLPEFSRCNKAFAKLRESVSLLKSNFNGYYRDFLRSGEKTIMLEHFILDVAKSSGEGDAELMRQFRVIISHYQKIAGDQTMMDPNVKATLEKINSFLDTVERGTQNLGKSVVSDIDDAQLASDDATDQSRGPLASNVAR